jgi:hypothetical protein
MAPSSGLSVLTKALHAATGPESSKSSSATTSGDSASSPASTLSEFGKHLKHALHEEWNKSANPSRVSEPCRPVRGRVY